MPHGHSDRDLASARAGLHGGRPPAGRLPRGAAQRDRRPLVLGWREPAPGPARPGHGPPPARPRGPPPGGRLGELVAPGSWGGETLLLALLARATAGGRLAALVDGADAFDPAAAVAAGTDLSSLLWVRCGGDTLRALRAADLLARCPGFSVVALDLGEGLLGRRPPIPPPAWRRLQRPVEGSGAALVLP